MKASNRAYQSREQGGGHAGLRTSAAVEGGWHLAVLCLCASLRGPVHRGGQAGGGDPGSVYKLNLKVRQLEED